MDMKRRDVFKYGVGKAAEAAGRIAGQKLALQRRTWLRPPFAKPELDFLLACTRCDKCIEACEFDVVFRLQEKWGRQVAGTPAMDLLNRGCHMCADWPCVAACEPEALKRPLPADIAKRPLPADIAKRPLPADIAKRPLPADDDPPLPPKMAHVRIDVETCLPYAGPECGACADSCPVPGALEWEGGVRPVVNQERCTGCALCREACIVDPKAIVVSGLRDDDAETADIR
jgi:ferredoxin-type protein NapG